jgi:hypothetical protein
MPTPSRTPVRPAPADARSRSAQPGRRRGRRRRRSPWKRTLALLLLVVAGGIGLVVVAVRLPVEWSAADGTVGPTPASPLSSPTGTAPAGTAAASGPSSPPLYRMPGPVPSSGPGTFSFPAGNGPVLGRSGTLHRYRVAVEDGSGENVEQFGAAVDRTLGDPRSWIASGQLRMQRVAESGQYDFTIYLATANTAWRMCLTGGVDIRVQGKPYTSCRAPGKVIINLDRWRLSVDSLVAAKMTLDAYRLYVINHEVGHQLGHGHEACPAKGGPAPVMQQQTLYLSGCLPNSWPYVNGKRLAGPPVQGL